MDLETGNLRADEQLEADIATAAVALQSGGSPAARRKAWDELQALQRRRSSQQVDRMEREQGLGQGG